MARHVTDGHVFAFEPVPQLFGLLMTEVEKRNLLSVVDARMIALSNKTGQADFIFFNGPNPEHPDRPLWNAGYSALQVSGTSSGWQREVIRVGLTTLDDELRGLNRVDFIKLDLEGGEFHALQGARTILRQFRPVIAFEDARNAGDVYGYRRQEFATFIDQCGFHFRSIFGISYTCEQWLDSAIWRPHYSLAMPNEFEAETPLREAVDQALSTFNIGVLFS
jgi:FkbM family methyltransferase